MCLYCITTTSRIICNQATQLGITHVVYIYIPIRKPASILLSNFTHTVSVVSSLWLVVDDVESRRVSVVQFTHEHLSYYVVQ